MAIVMENAFNITRKLQQRGKLPDIETLDRLIVRKNAFYSFADVGLM